MPKNGIPKSAITERALKKLIKQEAKSYSSVSAWASDNDITPQQVTSFLRKEQGAGLKIPEVLGYRPQIIFIPLDEDLICTPNPPRKPAKNPSKKVDHTREPLEKRHTRPKDARKEAKERLKKRRK